MYSKEMLELLGFKRGDCVTSDGGSTLYILEVLEEGVRFITKGPYAGSDGLKPKADDPRFNFIIPFTRKEPIEEADAALKKRREALSVPCILSGSDLVLASGYEGVRKIAVFSSKKEAIWGDPEVVDALVKRAVAQATEEMLVLVDEGASQEAVLKLLSTNGRISSATGWSLLDKTSIAAQYYAGLEDITVPSVEEQHLFLDEAPAGFEVFSLTQSYDGEIYIEPGDGYRGGGYGEGAVLGYPDSLPVCQWLIVRSAALGSDELLKKILQIAPEKITDVSKVHGLPKPKPPEIPEHNSASLTIPPLESWWELAGAAYLRAADTLPDMTGFDSMTLGSGSCQWTSPGYLLADRDLVIGEKVRVWAVAHLDGRVLKSVELTATKDNREKSVWPKALVAAINADTTLVEGSTLLQAGHLSKDGVIIADKGVDSISYCAAEESARAQFDRIWVFEPLARMYTNAPFVANQVIAGYVPDSFPSWVERICIQVRDRSSQYLHESHIVTCDPTHTEAGAQQKHVCSVINERSNLLRAGVLENDKITIKSAIEANALWVPQGSNLSVTIEPLMWYALDGFAAKGSLTAGKTICLNVHDDVSGVPLPGSPFKFTPKANETAEAAWPLALSQVLKQSLLAGYIHLGKVGDLNKEPAENATTHQWWQAGVPLRIWMSEPLGGATHWVPATPQVQDQNTAITLHTMLESQSNVDTELHLELRDRRSGNVAHSCSFILVKSEDSNYLSSWVESLQAFLEAEMIAVGIACSFGSATCPVVEEGREVSVSSLAFWLDASADVLMQFGCKTLSASVQLPRVRGAVTTAEVRNQILGVFLLCASGVVRNRENKLPKGIYEDLLATLRLNDCWATVVKSPFGESLVKLSDGSGRSYAPNAKGSESDEISNMMRKFYRKVVQLNFIMHEGAEFHHGLGGRSGLLQDYEVFKTSVYEHGEDRDLRGCWMSSLWSNILLPNDVLWKLFESKAAWKYLSMNGYDYVESQLELERDGMFNDLGVRGHVDEVTLYKTFRKYAFPCKMNLIENGSASCSVSFEDKPEKLTVVNVSGRSVAVTVQGHGCLQLASVLAPPSLASGYCFNFAEAHADQVLFEIHRPNGSAHTHPEIWNGYVTAEKIWQCVGLNPVILPTAPKYSPPDTLCADYASTRGSQLYDTTGASTNGVDERTGLFHAHYPICTLQGLKGRGPVIDLSLHYSARRANESALGDGWAFRFSSFDNRERQLTLSTGRTVQLTLKEIRTLIANTKNKVQRVGFTITDAQGSEDRLTRLTLEFPDGRKEVISKPDDHDDEESGSAYLKSFGEKVMVFLKQSEPKPDQKSNPGLFALFGPAFGLFGGGLTAGVPVSAAATAAVTEFKALIKKYDYALWERAGRPEGEFKQQLEVERAQAEQAAAMARMRAQFTQTLENLTRPAFLLTTSSIASARGDTLTLEWQGVGGHVRLKNIKDGDTVLLNASQADKPVLEGPDKTTFTLWPDSDEKCTIVLDIEDCLLKTLTRYRDVDGGTVDQRVQFGYSRDVALDRVLTSVAEEDGSVEAVKYGASSERLSPRVSLHTITPGANQPNIINAWKWSGYDYVLSAMRTPILNEGVDADAEPFTRWEYSVCDEGGSLLDRIIEEVPGQQRRTSQYRYQRNTADYPAELKPLARALQVSTTVTVEDLTTLQLPEQQS